MILRDEAATAQLGHALAAVARPGDTVTLSGPLGVGKTAFARGVLAALGHAGDVPSPTFAIVQPYDLPELPVWHVDLYRVNDPSELEELGLDMAGEGLLLIEWPERAGPTAFPDALRLTLEFAPDDARVLTAKVPPSWEDRWPR